MPEGVDAFDLLVGGLMSFFSGVFISSSGVVDFLFFKKLSLIAAFSRASLPYNSMILFHKINKHKLIYFRLTFD